MKRHERHTAEEAAAIIMENDDQLSYVESDDEDFEAERQKIIDEDSDDYEEQFSSEDEDDEEEPDENFDADVPIYNTSIEGVNWMKRSPSCRGRPTAANIVDPPPGPTNHVPRILDNPIDAFKVTFPTELVLLVLQYTINDIRNTAMKIAEAEYLHVFKDIPHL